MGKAFVAKLAKEGARDPEALAAWIGRKKHGKKAFQKLAAKKPQKASSRPAAKAPERDMKRGFQQGTDRLAVSDTDLEVLRDRVAFNRQQVTRFEAAGATEAVAETRKELAEQEQQIADAEYARETAVGNRAYQNAVQTQRAETNAAIAKARRSNDANDWAAAAEAAEALSRKAGDSPYGKRDSGWYAGEAKSARDSLAEAERREKQQDREKTERTLPPPKPGETPVAHLAVLGSDGMQSFGDPEMGRRALGRSTTGTSMPDTGAEGHDSALKNVSPGFRKKVTEARASGRPWLHHISRDGGGAEVHELQYADANGKPQKVTYLERNGTAWKRMSDEERRRRSSR